MKTTSLFPNRKPLAGQSDIAMGIGRILMIPTCLIVLLINLFPLKDQLFYLKDMCNRKNEALVADEVKEVKRGNVSNLLFTIG